MSAQNLSVVTLVPRPRQPRVASMVQLTRMNGWQWCQANVRVTSMEILLSNMACSSHSYFLVGRARLIVLPLVSNTTMGPHTCLKAVCERRWLALWCALSWWRCNLAQCQ